MLQVTRTMKMRDLLKASIRIEGSPGYSIELSVFQYVTQVRPRSSQRKLDQERDQTLNVHPDVSACCYVPHPYHEVASAASNRNHNRTCNPIFDPNRNPNPPLILCS